MASTKFKMVSITRTQQLRKRHFGTNMDSDRQSLKLYSCRSLESVN